MLYLRGFFGRSQEVIVARRGLTWSLNLKEGIDFAIFILGGFELQTLRQYRRLINEGDVVLDIGANVGAHTLPLAQLVGDSGKVFSFEPTFYAFSKQKINILLNPKLEPRISAHQLMLMATEIVALPESVYSSWPLESGDDLHNEHRGRLMATHGATKGTLDGFVRGLGLEKINFIKLDVDGNEYDVLLGGRMVFDTYKPLMMMELAPYVYENNPEKFDCLLEILWDLGYEIANVRSRNALPHDSGKIRRLIPTGGSINVLATPNSATRK
jgi:FkbM family methyltransferase